MHLHLGLLQLILHILQVVSQLLQFSLLVLIGISLVFILLLQVFILHAQFLSCVGLSVLNSMALSFFILDLRLELVHDFLILLNSSVLLLNENVNLSLQIMVLSRKHFILSLVSVGVIGGPTHALLQVFDLFVKVSLS